VQEGVNRKAILVPQQAVSRDPMGNPFTLIVDNENKVQLRKLTVDRTIGNKWLVTDGLKAGDRVIVEGMLKVRPGVLVKAVPFENGSEKNDKEINNTAPQTVKRTGGGE
jgi:membrane fusion protein (multidrug efflux system)